MASENKERESKGYAWAVAAGLNAALAAISAKFFFSPVLISFPPTVFL